MPVTYKLRMVHRQYRLDIPEGVNRARDGMSIKRVQKSHSIVTLQVLNASFEVPAKMMRYGDEGNSTDLLVGESIVVFLGYLAKNKGVVSLIDLLQSLSVVRRKCEIERLQERRCV